MERLALIFDQLDRAADELLARNPICDRLALILIDNAVELIVHETCRTAIMFDRPNWMGPPKYSSRERSSALSQDLDKKISFLENTGKIEGDIASFIKGAHELRNTSFHAGLKNEEILHAVATHFLFVASEVFRTLGTGLPFTRIVRDEQVLGERFFRYLETQEQRDHPLKTPDKAQIANQIAAKVVHKSEKIQEILSRQLIKEISRIERDLIFIEKNSPENPSREKAIEDAQFFYEIDKRSKELPLPHTPEYPSAYRAMISDARKNWTPKFRALPFESWKRKAQLLAHEKSALQSLEKFLNFRREIREISDAMSEMSLELDGWIQNQIDIALDK